MDVSSIRRITVNSIFHQVLLYWRIDLLFFFIFFFNPIKCTFQILGSCQGRRTGVGVTIVSNSLILGG